MKRQQYVPAHRREQWAELEREANALLRADARRQRVRVIPPPPNKRRAPQVQTGSQPLRLIDLGWALAQKRRQTANASPANVKMI
jgi:hypothetical protein